MAKVVTVTQYEAVDGSIFNTEAECNAHEFKLENGAKIKAAVEAFLNTVGAADRSRSIKGNVAEDFLAFYLPWMDAGCPEVERTVFDAVKEDKASDEDKAEVATEVADASEATEDTKPLF